MNALELSAKVWSAAARIAGARLATKQGLPIGQHRSRGWDGDVRNDVMGVAGEMIARLKVEERAELQTRGVLLSLTGPVDDVDLVLIRGNEETRLEVKTIEIRGRTAHLNVNRKAHENSLRRGASAYVPVAMRYGGSVAWIGGRVPIEDVGRWELYPYRYNDPAFRVPLHIVIPERFGIGRTELEVASDVMGFAATEDELARWAMEGFASPRSVADVLSPCERVAEAMEAIALLWPTSR